MSEVKDGMTPVEALERLQEGNRRFVAGEGTDHLSHGKSRRQELVDGQAPFAAVLGCSDSRVPVETVFDQGVGDLFVIRVAGNIAAPSQMASVEFTVEQFGTRLVVVLGHTRCGAVKATLDLVVGAAARPEPAGSGTWSDSSGLGHLSSIVDRILPPVRELGPDMWSGDPEVLARAAMRANVRASAETLRRESPVLSARPLEDVLVVGAEYSVETGVVTFFDGIPES